MTPKTILIIDDDNILRNTLAQALRNDNFNVLGASSAEDATEILQRISVDAIILDRMMGGIDGLTFLNEIRKSGNTTPILMLTAMGGAENTIDGLSSGANDYLAKPFQIRELILRLNNIIKINTNTKTKMPNGLLFNNGDFFVIDTYETPRLLPLSGEEKKLLLNLTHPLGNIAPAAPMVAKRLRNKLNIVLSNLDIITIRGQGYKLLDQPSTQNGDTK